MGCGCAKKDNTKTARNEKVKEKAARTEKPHPNREQRASANR